MPDEVQIAASGTLPPDSEFSRQSCQAASAPTVYALGSNGAGQLGIGHTDDVSTAQRCVFQMASTVHEHDKVRGPVATLGDIQKIVAGGNHTLALTATGRLFAAGRHGLRCSDGGDEMGMNMSTVFQELKVPVPDLSCHASEPLITDIAATWEASFIVVGGRMVLCWGKGTKGELGLKSALQEPYDSPYSVDVPKPALDLHQVGEDKDVNILRIQASMAHVVVLLSNGHVYGWGSCRKGQLGEQYIRRKYVWSPVRLDVEEDGVSILPFAPEMAMLGREYTVFLKVGIKPILWGPILLPTPSNLDWVLGHGDLAVSGWSSIHLLSGTSSDRMVRSFGKNNHGQHAPANLPPVQALAAGSEHCVAITNDKQVISWGWGEHGNCGEVVGEKGNVRNWWNLIPLPLSDQFVTVKDVAAGCATTFVLKG